jgi:hypothetical protein
MDDSDILARITALVEEERGLAGDDELPAERRQRRQAIEAQLDQCWDLLRQRQARREHGQDPNDATARSTDTVEKYLQ